MSVRYIENVSHYFLINFFFGSDLEKNHFVKIVTRFATVLLKMILWRWIYFVFTKKPLLKACLKLIH